MIAVTTHQSGTVFSSQGNNICDGDVSVLLMVRLCLEKDLVSVLDLLLIETSQISLLTDNQTTILSFRPHHQGVRTSLKNTFPDSFSNVRKNLFKVHC